MKNYTIWMVLGCLLILFSLGITFVVNPIAEAEIKADEESQTPEEMHPVLALPLFEKDLILYIGSHLAIVNDELISIDLEQEKVVPFIQASRTLVPVRFIAEKIGAEVGWDAVKQSVTLIWEDSEIVFIVDELKAFVNDIEIELDAAPVIMQGRTFLPLRALMDILEKPIQYHAGLIVISNEKKELDEIKILQYSTKLSVGLPFRVYENDRVVQGFASLQEAKAFAIMHAYTDEIRHQGQQVWTRYYRYMVFQEMHGEDVLLKHFEQYIEALEYARKWANSSITYTNQKVWSNKNLLSKSAYIEGVPLLLQYPELPRGCEVTSLAMLLQFAGVDVGKMELASKVRRDPTPFSRVGNVTTFGNPYDGFVGDMYSLNKPGLGVYHGPIFDLAEEYLPKQMVDMTGATFEDILYPVSQGTPVWVIVTSTYDIVPEHRWFTWQTPSGPVDITYQEHSVVIIGYDEQFIHVKDPFGFVNKVARAAFQKGWEQIGNQAITYVEAEHK